MKFLGTFTGSGGGGRGAGRRRSSRTVRGLPGRRATRRSMREARALRQAAFRRMGTR